MPFLALTIPDQTLDTEALADAARATVASALELPSEAAVAVVTTAHWSPSDGALVVVHGRDRGHAKTRAALAALRTCLEQRLAVDPSLVHVAWAPPPTEPEPA